MTLPSDTAHARDVGLHSRQRRPIFHLTVGRPRVNQPESFFNKFGHIADTINHTEIVIWLTHKNPMFPRWKAKSA
jgi:hypothetical protein